MTTVLLNTSGPGTWTVPAPLVAGSTISVEGWGGGGGGGSRSSGSAFGSGGGGGAYVQSDYQITPNDVANGIPYVVATGASGGSGGNGVAGNPTTFSNNNLNLLTNSVQGGAAVGVLPTNWTSNGTPTGTIVNVGTDVTTGLPFVDVQWSGTTSGTHADFAFDGFLVSTGSTAYCASAYLAIVGGSTTNISSVQIITDDWTSSDSFLAAIITTTCSLTSTLTQFSGHASTAATGLRVTTGLQINWTAGNAINITIRVAGAQIEAGTSPSAWKSTPGYLNAPGGSASNGASGGAGGTGGAGTGTKNSGGAGAAYNVAGAGGGGSGGADGAGNAGTTSGVGGQGDATTGGAGGTVSATSPGTAGTANQEGGGGGGALTTIGGSGSVAGAGGAPGGGGGGQVFFNGSSNGTGGAGAIGQIRITYVGAITNILALAATSAESLGLIKRAGLPVKLPSPQSLSIGRTLATSYVASAISTQSGSMARMLSIFRSFHASSGAAYSVATAQAHLYAKVLGAGSAEAAASLAHRIVSTIVSASSAEVAALILAKTYNAVVATVQTWVIAFLKAVAPAGYNATSTEAIGLANQYGKSYTASDTQAANLGKGIGRSRGVASAESAALVRFIHKATGLLAASLAALSAHPGKGLSVGSTEATFLLKDQPLHLGAASTETAAASRRLSLFRAFSAASGEAATAIKAVAARRSLTSPETARLVRTSGKLVPTSSGEAVGLVKRSAKAVAAINASVAAGVRLIGMAKAMTASSVVGLVTGALHHLAALTTASAEAAALLTARGKARALTAAQTNAATLSEHPIKILPENLALTQGQSARVLWSILHSVMAQSAAVQALVKSSGRSLFAWSTEVVTSARSATRSFIASIAADQVASERGSHVRTAAASSTQAAASVQSRGHSISATSAASQALRKTANKLLSFIGRQSWAVGKGAVALFETTSPESVSASAPFGVAIGTTQGQRPNSATWYHLFVPAWAAQQTTLLPPQGGRAEPPYFGSIDPSDQTTFCFDWSARADANDPIVRAIVTSVPAGMSFYGPVFISGTLVEVTTAPFTPLQLPVTYDLRCQAIFASGRRSSFSIPVTVRTL